MQNLLGDTICALSTPAGIGGIAVIRVSGPDTFSIVDKVLDRSIAKSQAYQAHFARLLDHEQVIDEVVAVVFKGPHSYTGQDTIEISVHGSLYIQQRSLELLQRAGARLATPGEYTMRAYLNGKMDLSQAEAVADLIAVESEAGHRQAMHQMRGGFSKQINALREQLIEFASLIELELDFGEEDVEFADRSRLSTLLSEIEKVVIHLIDSFALGNAIKNGIPVAILGAPNAGKSTLLNALLNEDRAIVSPIAGTTRDTVEDHINIAGVRFNFIDTAGIRATNDEIEQLGIARSFAKAKSAQVILLLCDATTTSAKDYQTFEKEVLSESGVSQIIIRVINKMDQVADRLWGDDCVYISAKQGVGIDELKVKIAELTQVSAIKSSNTIVTNARHHRALCQALTCLQEIQLGMNNGVTADFLAVDIRKTLYHLGEIVGQVQADDLLNSIFSKFCIGK
jgi:tRNA modification GTPase